MYLWNNKINAARPRKDKSLVTLRHFAEQVKSGSQGPTNFNAIYFLLKL